MRNSSLCLTCSSRSQEFFHKEKAIISEDTCNKILNDCAFSFYKTIKFVKALDMLPQSNHKTRQFGLHLNINLKYKKEQSSDYSYYINQGNVQNQLLIYMQKGKQSKLTVPLCDKFVKLRESTLVEQVAKIFLDKAKWQLYSEDYSKLLKTHSKIIQKRLNYWEQRTKKGSLSKLDFENDDDVQVVDNLRKLDLYENKKIKQSMSNKPVDDQTWQDDYDLDQNFENGGRMLRMGQISGDRLLSGDVSVAPSGGFAGHQPMMMEQLMTA